jgi:hypothetical protein
MVSARPETLYSLIVHCQERERLASVYLAAVARNNDAATAMATAFREGCPKNGGMR